MGGSHAQILGAAGAEALLLGMASGLAGLLLGQALLPFILGLFASPVRGLTLTARLDGAAFAFAFGISLLTTLMLAWIPVWRLSRLDAHSQLKEGGNVLGGGPGMRRLREALVVAGTALALVLLAGAGLLTRTSAQLLKADRGFDPHGKVAIWLDLPGPLQAPGERGSLGQGLEARLGDLPGIRSVSIAATVPLAGSTSRTLRKPDGSIRGVGPNPVSPAYRAGLGLNLLKGRWLPERKEGGSGVMVINQTMAREWFGTEDAIGRKVDVDLGAPWEVIGLVGDVRAAVREPGKPQFYYPYWQDPDVSDVLSLLLDCGRRLTPVQIDSVRKAIHEVDPRLGVRVPVDLEEVARFQSARERLVTGVLQMVSAVALLLAVFGLFALMSYSVSTRMTEFGIRLALGASPGRIAASILRRGLVLAGLGIALGLACSWGLTRFIRSLLFETNPLDFPVYLAVSGILLAVAGLACWIPARRAARVEPAGLLRSE
jgi:putative ABC transport system permease protein